jgi:hypothetical protein
MTHHNITKILYLFMVGFLLSTGVVLAVYSQAQPAYALPMFQSYGGWVDSVLPNPTPAGIPNPVCPIYTLITNVDLTDGLSPEFGIFIPPLFPAPTYDYNNLYVPGTPVIGGLVPIPCVGGIAPVPIYPLFYDAADGPFYLTGTGAL